MKSFELVIAGGGLTAARAVKSYREAGGEGRIALVSEENVVPYHRPALSKKYLRGEKSDTPIVEDEGFYAENDVELLLGHSVVSVDPGNRRVATDDGPLGFEKLLIATGAAPRRLRVPGVDLDGVFSLRTLEDSRSIREAAVEAEHAVVVGAGFIGMEAAASLRQLGIAVTLIHMGSGLFDILGSAELSDALSRLYEEKGVDVHLEEVVSAFGGTDRLEYVETASGRRFAADLAVVGVGVVPNVGFLDGSGLELDDGVVVGSQFETNVPGIYAAGDVANFFDPLYGRQRRIEHWSNASYQGAEVGRILAGAEGGYDEVSSFFTEVFGVTVKVFGDATRFDELSTHGTLESGMLASYGLDGRLVAVLAVGQDDETEAFAKTLIAEGAPAGTLHALERALS